MYRSVRNTGVICNKDLNLSLEYFGIKSLPGLPLLWLTWLSLLSFLYSSSSFDLDYDFQRDYYDRWVNCFCLCVRETESLLFVTHSWASSLFPDVLLLSQKNSVVRTSPTSFSLFVFIMPNCLLIKMSIISTAENDILNTEACWCFCFYTRMYSYPSRVPAPPPPLSRAVIPSKRPRVSLSGGSSRRTKSSFSSSSKSSQRTSSSRTST